MSETTSPDRESRAYRWIEELTTFTPRFAGSESEQRAARRVLEWMQEVGVQDTTIVPVAARPRMGLVLGLHAAVALLGMLFHGFTGVALCALAAISFRSEIRNRKPMISRSLPTAQSVNAIGRVSREAAKRRVILSAHIDAAQAGFLFSKTLADLFASQAHRPGNDKPPIAPLALPEGLMIASAVLTFITWVGGHGLIMFLLSMIVGIGLAITLGLALEWAFANPTPGANDNASAVAAMLTCAERLLPALPADTELWMVGTGAEEVGCDGMHGFVEDHRHWPIESTYFVNFECVGGGTLHYIRSEGTLGKSTYPVAMTELARRVAAEGSFGDLTGTDLLAATDGHIPAAHQYPTLSLISLESNGVPRNYHQPDDTVEALDMSMVVRAADFGAAVAMAALRAEDGPIKER